MHVLALRRAPQQKGEVIHGDVYTGTETVEYLANGVPDRVFLLQTTLHNMSSETLRKQATYLRKNKNLTVTIEGHADEKEELESITCSW